MCTGPTYTDLGFTAITIVAFCALAATLIGRFPRHGTGKRRATGDPQPAVALAPVSVPRHENAAAEEPPLLKLYDPYTEDTLQIALPIR
ncbi:hypothetical protein ACFXKC_28600 [Streptomyces sp. NPDC059340]|uniref:hypothetical protein n=1 Tax=Streptomyces sp. NPDC059340 TaxID=3346806 RepID=UPI003685310E